MGAGKNVVVKTLNAEGSADGNGYAIGGVALDGTWTEAEGVATFDSPDPTWAGPITFDGVLFAVYYSDTSVGKKLLFAKDLGGAKQRSNESFSVLHHADGLFFI